MGRKTQKANTSIRAEDEYLEFEHVRNVICERLDRFEQFLNTRRDEIFQVEIQLKSAEEDFS